MTPPLSLPDNPTAAPKRPERISAVVDDADVRKALIILAARRYTATLVGNSTTKRSAARRLQVERDLTDAAANVLAEVKRYIDRLIGLDDVAREADREAGPTAAERRSA